MSLNFDLSNINNYQVVTTHPDDLGEEDHVKRLNPVTDALIWHSMICGFTEITEKNWQEVFHRIYLRERACGALRVNHELGNIYITVEDVFKHIGLRTNSSARTKAEFFNSIELFARDESRARIKAFLTT